MAGTILNTFTNTDNADVDSVESCLTLMFKGKNDLTLTHSDVDDTTIPAIAAGSVIEVNGSLISFTTEEAISTTDPHTADDVEDGIVYIMIEGTLRLAYFTSAEPVWYNSKQGWYGVSGYENYKYIGQCIKSGSTYIDKFIYKEFPKRI